MRVHISKLVTGTGEGIVHWDDLVESDGYLDRLGLKNLFIREGACHSCHAPGGAGYARYQSCSNCHDNPEYPEWLNFSNDASVLRAMRSYYYPGHPKLDAIVLRAIDGTMPPGAAPRDAAPPPASSPGGPGTQSVGWCSEIVDAWNLWLSRNAY
jgi:hypothetical protein